MGSEVLRAFAAFGGAADLDHAGSPGTDAGVTLLVGDVCASGAAPCTGCGTARRAKPMIRFYRSWDQILSAIKALRPAWIRMETMPGSSSRSGR